MKNAKVKIYSVSEITKRIKSVLENNFLDVWIEGEISNYKKALSGHVYLTIKDEKSQLRCVIFRNAANKINFELKDGLKVLCFGRIGVYEKQGSYQLYVEKVEPKGYGALQLAFEQLKERLEKEGLFRNEHKKAIPLLPHKIGVVTSSTGAAVKDILDVINKRFPNSHILINPVRVQGGKAAGEISRAIKEFNELKDIDVLIVGRGGGSLEDLWAFNEEVVARAIFNSNVPIISAVGHQIDYTISDFVADVRAATPSKAAEMVIGKKKDLEEKLINYSYKLRTELEAYSQQLDKKLTSLTQSRFFRQPDEILLESKLRLDDLSDKLTNKFVLLAERKTERLKDYSENLFFRKPIVIIKEASRKFIENKDKFIRAYTQYRNLKEQEFNNYIAKLESLSPLAVLKRGYSVTKNAKTDKIIIKKRDIKKDDSIQTRISDGRILSIVKEVSDA